MKYTDLSSDIIFLRDADIVQNFDKQTISNNIVLSNGIPSYDLFKEKYDETSSKIEFLSSKISTALRHDLSAMRFFGDVQLSNNYDLVATTPTLLKNTLYCLLKTNNYINIDDKELIAGFTFHATGENDEIYTISSYESTIEIRNNDFIVINNCVDCLSNVMISDIVLIKDYDYL